MSHLVEGDYNQLINSIPGPAAGLEPGILVVGRELTRAYSFQVFARPFMIEGTTDQEPQSLSDLRGRVTGPGTPGHRATPTGFHAAAVLPSERRGSLGPARRLRARWSRCQCPARGPCPTSHGHGDRDSVTPRLPSPTSDSDPARAVTVAAQATAAVVAGQCRPAAEPSAT
jgi:hypothetical protein